MSGILELNEFEAVFHLAILFNFAYAIENFSKQINLFFLEPTKVIVGAIHIRVSRNIHSYLERQKPPDPKYGKKFDDEVNLKYLELDERLKNLMKRRVDNFDYDNKFNPIYLITGLYTLGVMVLSGFLNVLGHEYALNSLFRINIVLSLFIVIIFSTTFLSNVKRLSNFWVLILFILLLIIYSLSFRLPELFGGNSYIPSENVIITSTVAITLSIFILHFFRVVINPIVASFFALIFIVKFRMSIRKAIIQKKRVNKAIGLLKEALDETDLEKE